MALPTTLVTTVGTVTLGVPLTSLTVIHDGHEHTFSDVQVVAMFPYGDSEVRYEIRNEHIVGVEAVQVSAFSVI